MPTDLETGDTQIYDKQFSSCFFYNGPIIMKQALHSVSCYKKKFIV